MRIPVLLILFLFVSTSILSARPITLEDALALAKAHSYDVKRTTAEAEAAANQLQANKLDRWPTLSLAASAFYNDYVSTLNITIPNVTSIEREIGVHDNYQSNLRLTLPLYTGGRIGTGIQLAKSEQKIREALAVSSKQQIALETRSAWLRLYRSTELVHSAEAAVKRVGVVTKDVQSLFSAGAADSVGILEVLVASTKAETDLDAAQSMRRADEITLAVLLGLSPDEQLEIVDTLPLPVLDSTLPAEFWTATPTYQVADYRLRAAKSNIRSAQAEYLPSLSAFADYGYGRPNQDRFNSSWNDNFTVGASLNWSFNLGGRSFKSEAAKRSLYSAADQQRQATAEQLNREAQLSKERMQLALQQYDNALRTFQLSSRNFELAKKQHGEGVLSTNRLLEIEADLDRAQSAVAAAKSDFYITQSAWYYTIGSDKLEKGI